MFFFLRQTGSGERVGVPRCVLIPEHNLPGPAAGRRHPQHETERDNCRTDPAVVPFKVQLQPVPGLPPQISDPMS